MLYLTYEELKRVPSFAVSFFAGSAALYLTYEELKRNAVSGYFVSFTIVLKVVPYL